VLIWARTNDYVSSDEMHYILRVFDVSVMVGIRMPQQNPMAYTLILKGKENVMTTCNY